MDNKQRRAAALDPPRQPPPGGDVDEADPRAIARKYKAHQKAITRGLRRFFDSVASEPVPDEFIGLLHKMDESRQDQ